MQRIGWYILYGLCFAVGVVVFLFQTSVTPIHTNPAPTPAPTRLILKPPLQSLNAVLTIEQGTAQYKERSDKEYKEATSGATLFTDESITLAEGGRAVIAISQTMTCTLSDQAEVTLANLYEENLVLQQKSGAMTCSTSSIPLSIRALHALIEIAPESDVSLTINQGNIILLTKEGAATLAYVDFQNETHIEKTVLKNRLVFDDENRLLIDDLSRKK